jgi:hypothetical protein
VFAGIGRQNHKAAQKQGLAGWGARIRTWEWRNQNPLPYHDEIVAEIAIKAFAARRLNG